MKKFVLDLLQQRELTHLFTESQYNAYRRKVTGSRSGINEYYAALQILDMFILNACVPAHML